MDGNKPTIERLEVEDDEARLQRLQSTLEKLNTSSGTTAPAAPPSFGLHSEGTKPHFIPPSDLLSRVQAFLPQIEASNAALQQRLDNDPSSIDIENVEDGAEQYIEMNLGLGLFEQRRAGPTSDESDSSSDSESDSVSDSSEESPSDGQ